MSTGPDSLTAHDAVLTQVDLGLQVLDSVISTRWMVLPPDQRQGRFTRGYDG